MLRNIPPIKDELFALFAKMFAALTARRAHAAALKLHHFTNLSMIRKKCYLQSIPNTLELSLNRICNNSSTSDGIKNNSYETGKSLKKKTIGDQ